jgi:hypothetical protein
MAHGSGAPIPALLLSALALLSSCQREVSGKFLAKFSNGVYWLQIVRTPDNHLTGQLESLLIGKDGRIQREAVAVTGAVNAGNVTISATMFGLQVVTLSGALDGSKLTLTGGNPSPLVLGRSDMSEYEQVAKDLNIQSQRIITATASAQARQRMALAQRNLVVRIGQGVSKMREFDSQADVHLSRFPGGEERYRAITARMTQYLNRERSILGGGSAAVARSQILVAMNQASIATEELHNAANSLESAVRATAQPLSTDGIDLAHGCRATVNSGDLTQDQAESRNAACGQLFPTLDAFQQKLGAMSRGLAHLQQVYQQERRVQAGLLQTAQRLE